MLTLQPEIRRTIRDMDQGEIRHVVSSYYQIQEFRKASNNMARSQKKDDRPYELVEWLGDEERKIENQIRSALKDYAENNPTGQWLLSMHGIGPVIAAGLLAHIDINKAPTVGHIWSFAGLNPKRKWEKGQKRPWNAELKTLCFKIGDSFVKTSGSDKSFYGPVYRLRKQTEIDRSEAGECTDAAAEMLQSFNIKEPATRACYESGKLPPAHLDMRARRVAVKLFLSHFHDVLMWNELGRRAPRPYALEHMGHAHMIECPNPPWESLTTAA